MFTGGHWILCVSEVRHETDWLTSRPLRDHPANIPSFSLLSFLSKHGGRRYIHSSTNSSCGNLSQRGCPPSSIPASISRCFSTTCWVKPVNFFSGHPMMPIVTCSAYLPHCCASKQKPQRWRPSHANQGALHPLFSFGSLLHFKEMTGLTYMAPIPLNH